MRDSDPTGEMIMDAPSGALVDMDLVAVGTPKTRSEQLQRLIDCMLALFGTGASMNSMLWNPEPNNKAAARTLRKPLEGRHLAMHIEGRARVGAIPRTTETGTYCQWACIDLDVNRDPVIPEPTALAAVAALRDSLRTAGITPWIERSKSRGWHVWVFFDGPVPVGKLRGLLKQHLAAVSAAVLPPGSSWQDVPDAICPRGDNTTFGNGTWLPACGANDAPATRFFHTDDLVPYPDLQHTEVFEFIHMNRSPAVLVEAYTGPVDANTPRYTGPKAGAIEMNEITKELSKRQLMRHLRVWKVLPDKLRIQCPFHKAEAGRSTDNAVLMANGSFKCLSCGKKTRGIANFAKELRNVGSSNY
jgi:hypothetical protein